MTHCCRAAVRWYIHAFPFLVYCCCGRLMHGRGWNRRPDAQVLLVLWVALYDPAWLHPFVSLTCNCNRKQERSTLSSKLHCPHPATPANPSTYARVARTGLQTKNNLELGLTYTEYETYMTRYQQVLFLQSAAGHVALLRARPRYADLILLLTSSYTYKR